MARRYRRYNSKPKRRRRRKQSGMKKAHKGKTPPEFMSTHPSPDNRIKNINGWITEVTLKYPPIKVS